MASIESFHYAHGSSFLHSLDERLKLALILAYCTAAAWVLPLGLVPLSVVLCAVMAAVRIRVMRVIRELAGFYLLLLLVFVLHAYSFPDRGSAIYNIPLPPPAGIISGCILIARLLLVLFAGVVFSETTKHTRLTSAVHSLLGKVPFVPSFLIATMMGLAIMFVPVLLDTFHEISDALRSRCIDRMHNPIKKMVSYIAPLFVQIFIRTEEIAEAMESRCFNGTYTQPRFRITTGDIIVFACGIAVCIFSTFIGFLL